MIYNMLLSLLLAPLWIEQYRGEAELPLESTSPYAMGNFNCHVTQKC